MKSNSENDEPSWNTQEDIALITAFMKVAAEDGMLGSDQTNGKLARPRAVTTRVKNKGKAKMSEDNNGEDIKRRCDIINELSMREIALAEKRLELKKRRLELKKGKLELRIKKQNWEKLKDLMNMGQVPQELENLKKELIDALSASVRGC